MSYVTQYVMSYNAISDELDIQPSDFSPEIKKALQQALLLSGRILEEYYDECPISVYLKVAREVVASGTDLDTLTPSKCLEILAQRGIRSKKYAFNKILRVVKSISSEEIAPFVDNNVNKATQIIFDFNTNRNLTKQDCLQILQLNKLGYSLISCTDAKEAEKLYGPFTPYLLLKFLEKKNILCLLGRPSIESNNMVTLLLTIYGKKDLVDLYKKYVLPSLNKETLENALFILSIADLVKSVNFCKELDVDPNKIISNYKTMISTGKIGQHIGLAELSRLEY